MTTTIDPAFRRPVESNAAAEHVRQFAPVQIHSFESRLSDDWQSYVDQHADGTLFHGLAWKRAVEQAFGHRSWYLMARQGGRVVGVLPLAEVRSVLAGRLLVSVPYGTYGGILGDDVASRRALFRAAESLAGRIGASSLQLRSIHAAIPRLPVQHTHATFRKPLPLAASDVLAAFPRKARAAARRAASRADLSVEFDGAHLATLWRLYARSMRRLASPNYPYRFFDALARALPGRHVVQIVRSQGRPVAGLLTLLHGDTVMPYFMGMDERADIYGLSHYLYLRSMTWGVEHGYRTYDFGRTRVDNSGPFNFKRFCGFEPTLLEYQTLVMPGKAAPDLSPGSQRWATARRVWKTLPLSLTRPLGGWLSRSIPG